MFPLHAIDIDIVINLDSFSMKLFISHLRQFGVDIVVDKYDRRHSFSTESFLKIQMYRYFKHMHSYQSTCTPSNMVQSSVQL
jgi:hypothetical protein